MTKPLSNRIALVTGASRGIGRAIATRLLAEGAEVIGTATRPDADMPKGCKHEAVRLDDSASVAAFAILCQKIGCKQSRPNLRARTWISACRT